jgi:hypothetical protein
MGKFSLKIAGKEHFDAGKDSHFKEGFPGILRQSFQHLVLTFD